MSVQVIGVDGVQVMLRDYMHPKLTRRLQNALNTSTKVFEGPLRSEARHVSRRMGRAVVRKQSYKGIRGAHDVSKGEPHMHIGFRIATAWFSHLVIGGTRDHGPRKKQALRFKGRNGKFVTAKRVRGVRANPMIAVVARGMERTFDRAFLADLDRTETKG